MKKPYSDYVQHGMRFYINYRDISSISSQSDIDTWKACDKVIKKYSEFDRLLLMSAYTEGIRAGSIADLALRHNLNINYIWNLIRSFETLVAVERGLI